VSVFKEHNFKGAAKWRTMPSVKRYVKSPQQQNVLSEATKHCMWVCHQNFSKQEFRPPIDGELRKELLESVVDVLLYKEMLFVQLPFQGLPLE
jgi:hypothetical protein